MQSLNIFLSIALFILSFCLLVQLINYRTLQRLGRLPRHPESPFVSVLVPARNEEANIARCVRSLLGQEYTHFEIIVLDDESEDATWEILEKMARQQDRLRVLKGQPLPEGWVGKNWACHQMAGLSRGDYLLFVDADTRHAPSMLRAAVDAAACLGADLLTAMPRERTESLSEVLTIPLITWGAFAALPLPLAFRLPWPVLSITVGQFLFFKRAAYRRIGGHAAVADQVVEDMALGRRIKSVGLKWRLVDGSGVVECRMYTSFNHAVDGLSKTIFGALNYSITLVFLCSLMLGLVFCLPPLVLLASPVWMSLPATASYRALVAVGLALFSWGIANRRFQLPGYATFLYPAIAGIAVFIFLRSMVLSIQGKACWKGRALSQCRFRW